MAYCLGTSRVLHDDEADGTTILAVVMASLGTLLGTNHRFLALDQLGLSTRGGRKMALELPRLQQDGGQDVEAAAPGRGNQRMRRSSPLRRA